MFGDPEDCPYFVVLATYFASAKAGDHTWFIPNYSGATSEGFGGT